MLSENTIKEKISLRFLQLVGNLAGFQVEQPADDTGVDLIVREVVERVSAVGKRQTVTTGREIDFQLKATSHNRDRTGEDHITYDLRAKNYNDLVTRRNDYIKPLVLVLYLLPENKDNWIRLYNGACVLRDSAFWYLPESKELRWTHLSYLRTLHWSTKSH